jgi:3'-phosphoadenosine 5'-phosphosulfate sulfotransferase (PAPS reductase)/FAD synthetase
MDSSITFLEERVEKSVKLLKEKAFFGTLLIGLSGGKDSLCLCELVKIAEITNVKYFFMYFLPDLRIQDDLLAYPIRRFNIPEHDVIKTPSEHFMACMRNGIYTWPFSKSKEIPNVSRTDIFRKIAKDNKGSIITGVKKSDGIVMSRIIDQNRGIATYPMKDWTLKDVFTFMELRYIDIPPLTKEGCRGVGIEDANILFIYNHYYDDFLKIEEVFPFVRAIVKKYAYYNLKNAFRIA